MRTAWHDIREHWATFEATVESHRTRLGCSYRGAWFRGQENANWLLLPTAFRSSAPPGLTEALEEFGGRPPSITDLRRARQLRIDAPIKPNTSDVEADVAAAIRVLSSDAYGILAKLGSISDELSKAPPIAGCQSLDHHSIDVPAPSGREAPGRKDLKQRRIDLTDRLAEIRQQIVTLRSLRYGEKDAFAIFRSRAALTVGSSSWETLAAMQHYGAPTRLLDWTDTLAVAVYFATKQVRQRMVEMSGSIANWLEACSEAVDLADFNGLGEPAVWILNPFRLARFAISKNTIEDLTLRPDLDYFECFHVRCSWPFPCALPATLPWRNPRMFAQRGHFTVHGTDVRALEQQLVGGVLASKRCKNPILAQVPLPLLAAIFAVRYVVQFVGLDAFSVFRDEDNLGAILREFMHRRRHRD